MQLHSIPADQIFISKNRYRKQFIPEKLIELASSIAESGLIQPVVVRKDTTKPHSYILVAGERRMRAMIDYLWGMFNQDVTCGGYRFPKNHIPCLLFSELDELSAKVIEVEENVCRTDFTWQERAAALQNLEDLRRMQAAKAGKPEPTHVDIAEEVLGTKAVGGPLNAIRQQLIVAKRLDDPDVAGAKTVAEAFKTLKRKEQLAANAKLAAEVGATFNSSVHSIFNDDCREVSKDFPDYSFDVIVTDPPYGIDADTYGDSGGAGGSKGEHFYSDSWRYFNELMQWFAGESFRVCKPHSHIYVFCDVDNFVLLKSFMTQAGWNVFRTPMVWVNPQGARAPWPEKGPQRKYQLILFAIKGERPVSRLLGDVLTYSSDPQLNHPAQKPVALYLDLLRRSANPGDSVADYFMGTGTILPAAHEMKCKATGVEVDKSAYGTAIKRLQELK